MVDHSAAATEEAIPRSPRWWPAGTERHSLAFPDWLAVGRDTVPRRSVTIGSSAGANPGFGTGCLLRFPPPSTARSRWSTPPASESTNTVGRAKMGPGKSRHGPSPRRPHEQNPCSRRLWRLSRRPVRLTGG